MSRPLVVLSALAFVVLGVLPVVSMLVRIEGADLAGLVDARTLELLGRTLWLGFGSAGLALLLGAPFGFLVARTDVPGAGWMRTLGVVPLFLPPLLIALTWTVLTNWRGAWPAILVLGTGTFPLVSIFTARAFERIDARREEAAVLLGGTRAALRASWRLVAPAALCGACLSFVFAVNDFSVPDYMSWVGPKFNVYADEVFATWGETSHPGRAVAAALPLVLLTLASLVPALALRRRGALATLDSDFQRPRTLPLGRWRWAACGFCLLVLGLSVGVPLGRLSYEAGGGPEWSVAGLQGAFSRALELARDDLRNSLLFSAAAATLAVPLALVLGHALERSRVGRLLEPLVLLPIGVPAILFGIGIIALWNHPVTARFYDGPGMVILLLAGRFGAFAILIATGAAASLDTSLEDAGRTVGAGPARRLTHIVAPGMAASLGGGWLLVFVLSMRELDAAIFVPAANATAAFRVYNAVHFGRDDFVAALALMLVFLIVLPGLVWSIFGRRRLEVLP